MSQDAVAPSAEARNLLFEDGRPSAEFNVISFRDICYHPKGEQAATKWHYLDVYAPRACAADTVTSGVYPTVFFFHGGGWRRGDRYSWLGFSQNVGEALAKQGCVAVIPSYTKSLKFPPWIYGALGATLLPLARFVLGILAPDSIMLSLPACCAGYLMLVVSIRKLLLGLNWARHPDHIKDCAMAVQWAARGEISKFGGDPNRLVLTGQSAGAHMASLLALPQTDFLEKSIKQNQLKGLVSISGIHSGTRFRRNLVHRILYSYVFSGSLEWEKCFALGFCSDVEPLKAMCPTLLINASFDVGLLSHAQEFAEVLRRGQVAVEGPHILPQTDHFTMMLRVGKPNPSTSDKMLLSLMRHFIDKVSGVNC